YQKGLLPVSARAIERAIELNGVSVQMNKQAFLWGRRAAHDRAAVEAIARPDRQQDRAPAQTLDEIVSRRMSFLTDYQNAAYAERYRSLVDKVRRVEEARTPGMSGLAEAVARNYFKLLAYKDEYEVARLYTDGTFAARLNREFTGDYRLEFHLAPPLLAQRDPVTGHLRKRAFGQWMLTAFRLLARLRFLRGTAFDIFGRTEERRRERALISEYETLVNEIADNLATTNHDLAVALAQIPDRIRGFALVEERTLAAEMQEEARLLERFRASPVERRAVARRAGTGQVRPLSQGGAPLRPGAP